MTGTEFDLRDTMQKYMDANQEGRSPWLGPSSVGKCYRQAAYQYFGVEPTDYVNKDKADLGTLLHLGWSALIRAMYDPIVREPDVPLGWPELGRKGEADDVDWKNRIVTDLKTANARSWQAMVDRGEPYDSYWNQAEVYALSLHRLADEDWTLRIVLLNTETGGRVEFTRPADPERGLALVTEMGMRHNTLLDAVEMGSSPEDFPQEGKGPGRGFPCDWCPFVSRCWPDSPNVGMSPQAQTIVDDPDEVAFYAAEYRDGAAMEKEGAKRKYDAAAFLNGITGTFAGWTVGRTKDGADTEVLDEDAVMDMLIEHGLPVPMLKKPGRRGYVTVRKAR